MISKEHKDLTKAIGNRTVIPAQAGIQMCGFKDWIPAFAGKTRENDSGRGDFSRHLKTFDIEIYGNTPPYQSGNFRF